MKTHSFKQKAWAMASRPYRTAAGPYTISASRNTGIKIRRILRDPRLQAKLTVGAPDDIYEQEADRMADEVMRMPEPRVQTAPT